MKIENIEKVSRKLHELNKCKETVKRIEKLIRINSQKTANCVKLVYEDGGEGVLRLHFSSENHIISDMAKIALKHYTDKKHTLEYEIEQL